MATKRAPDATAAADNPTKRAPDATAAADNTQPTPAQDALATIRRLASGLAEAQSLISTIAASATGEAAALQDRVNDERIASVELTQLRAALTDAMAQNAALRAAIEAGANQPA